MFYTQGSYKAETAIGTLKSMTDLDFTIEFNANDAKNLDGQLIFSDQSFPFNIKKNIRTNQVAELIEYKKQSPSLILITNTLPEKIKKILRENKINYLEESGNAFIQSSTGLIFIDGQKPITKPEINKDKAFTKK